MKVIRKPMDKETIVHSRSSNCCNGCVGGPPSEVGES